MYEQRAYSKPAVVADLLRTETRQRIAVEGIGLPRRCVPFFRRADHLNGHDHFVFGERHRLLIAAIDDSAVGTNAEFQLTHLDTLAIDLHDVVALIFVGEKDARIVGVIELATIVVDEILRPLEMPELPIVNVRGVDAVFGPDLFSPVDHATVIRGRGDLPAVKENARFQVFRIATAFEPDAHVDWLGPEIKAGVFVEADVTNRQQPIVFDEEIEFVLVLRIVVPAEFVDFEFALKDDFAGVVVLDLYAKGTGCRGGLGLQVVERVLAVVVGGAGFRSGVVRAMVQLFGEPGRAVRVEILRDVIDVRLVVVEEIETQGRHPA